MYTASWHIVITKMGTITDLEDQGKERLRFPSVRIASCHWAVNEILKPQSSVSSGTTCYVIE